MGIFDKPLFDKSSPKGIVYVDNKQDYLGKGDVKPIFKKGDFGNYVGSESQAPTFEDGNYGNYTGASSKFPIFKGGKFKDFAGFSSEVPNFSGGKFGRSAGKESRRPTFSEGKFGGWTGEFSDSPTFKDGDFEEETGFKSKKPLFEGGKYKDSAGSNSERPIFENGKFGNWAGRNSNNPIVLGGRFGNNLLSGATEVRAYVPSAKEIGSVVSGYLILDDVKKISLKIKKDVLILTTQDKLAILMNKKGFSNIKFIDKKVLDNKMDMAGFKRFRNKNFLEEGDAELVKKMDNLIRILTKDILF